MKKYKTLGNFLNIVETRFDKKYVRLERAIHAYNESNAIDEMNNAFECMKLHVQYVTIKTLQSMIDFNNIQHLLTRCFEIEKTANLRDDDMLSEFIDVQCNFDDIENTFKISLSQLNESRFRFMRSLIDDYESNFDDYAMNCESSFIDALYGALIDENEFRFVALRNRVATLQQRIIEIKES